VRSPNAPLKGVIACLREAASAKAGGSRPTKSQQDTNVYVLSYKGTKTNLMDGKPLAGKKILITRARDQAAVFASSLKDLGAEVIELPTIEIVPPASWKGLDRAIDQLGSYDWLIFTSANGVNFFWQRLEERGKGPRLPSSLKVCAIGPATAYQLKEKGIEVDYTPKEFVAEAILKGFEKMMLKGKRILLARAREARDVLPEGLKQLGAKIDVVETYRTVKPKGGSKKLKELLTKGKIDAITFTSSSTVNHFVELLKKEDLQELLKNCAIACIGPITARTAKKWKMRVQIQPKEYTIPTLTQAIVQYFLRKAHAKK
jgi:uroporphyrinogen III methyltransferase/synthase